MARAGDVITNPRSGERIVFLSTGAETGGESLVLEYKAPAGRRGPPAHIHARHEERFDVLSGTAIVRLGKVERALGPGESVTVPPGVVHGFVNQGNQHLEMRVELRPAGDMDRFFETVFRLAREGKTNDRGRSGLLQDALLAHEHGLLLPQPPVVLQRPAIAILARLARWRGLGAR